MLQRVKSVEWRSEVARLTHGRLNLWGADLWPADKHAKVKLEAIHPFSELINTCHRSNLLDFVQPVTALSCCLIRYLLFSRIHFYFNTPFYICIFFKISLFRFTLNHEHTRVRCIRAWLTGFGCLCQWINNLRSMQAARARRSGQWQRNCVFGSESLHVPFVCKEKGENISGNWSD